MGASGKNPGPFFLECYDCRAMLAEAISSHSRRWAWCSKHASLRHETRRLDCSSLVQSVLQSD